MGILIFSLGLIVGSFLNVVIYRLPRDEGIGFSRSYCPECETKLEVMDLIPVVSYIFLGGKCRYCGAEISYRYPLVELLTALVLLGLYLKFGLGIELVIYGIFCLLLLACGIIDLEWMIIPNKLTLPGLAAGLLAGVWGPHLSFSSSLLGALVPAAILFTIAVISRGGMGMGDVKLIAVIGSFLGLWPAVVSIFLGAVVGSLFAGGMLIKGDKGLKSKLPFGIFLSLAGIVMTFWGPEIIGLYWRVIN